MPITYDREHFFAAVRGTVFRGHMTASQVKGISNDKRTGILDTWERLQPDGDARFIAYMLGTADWETAHTMQPIEEIGHGRGRAYGAPAGPWHQVYDGRGDVQLTWEANYAKATTRLRALGVLTADEDLVQTPALAMRQDVAAAIMFYGMIDGWFTGRKLATYFNATTDWLNARRIINGTDHAADIAAIARQFYAALTAATTESAPPAASPSVAGREPPVTTPRASAPPAPKPTILGRLETFFGKH